RLQDAGRRIARCRAPPPLGARQEEGMREVVVRADSLEDELAETLVLVPELLCQLQVPALLRTALRGAGQLACAGDPGYLASAQGVPESGAVVVDRVPVDAEHDRMQVPGVGPQDRIPAKAA